MIFFKYTLRNESSALENSRTYYNDMKSIVIKSFTYRSSIVDAQGSFFLIKSKEKDVYSHNRYYIYVYFI